MNATGQAFLERAAHLLTASFGKIREAVDLLSEDEIWSRPNEASNSIGNLLLHLSGNVRQHVIGGLAGAPDTRDRPAEFAARGGHTKAELLSLLESTVGEAVTAIRAFLPARLLEEAHIQGKTVRLLDDLFTIVEHFGYHAGQIVLIVKAVKNHRFPWYRHLDPK